MLFLKVIAEKGLEQSKNLRSLQTEDTTTREDSTFLNIEEPEKSYILWKGSDTSMKRE